MPNKNTPMGKLIRKLVERISELEKKIADGTAQDERVNDTSIIINNLKENPYSICYEGVSMAVAGLLNKLMGESPDYIELTTIAKNLSVVAEAKNIGFDDASFTDDELKDFNKLIESLEELVEKEKEQRAGEEGAISAAEDNLLFAEIIMDKLNKGDNGTEYLSDEEMDYVLGIIDDLSAKEKIDVLEELREFQQKIFLENMRRLEGDVFFREEGEDQANVTRLDRDLLIQIFKSNGFDYSRFTVKYMDLIEKKCDLSRIQGFFNFIKGKPEFEFLREYGSDSVKGKQKELEIKMFYGLLKYSTPEILDYLLNDAKTREVELQKILTIEGVYKRTSKVTGTTPGGGGGSPDVTIVGTYDYYVRNTAILDALSERYRKEYRNPRIDLYKNAVEYGKIVMITPPDIVRGNIHLLEMYGIGLIEDFDSDLQIGEDELLARDYNVRAITTLSARNLAERVDWLIEAGGYNYVSNYPSILKAELDLKKIIYAEKTGTLEYDSKGRIKEIRRAKAPINIDAVLDRSAVEAVESQIPDYYKEKAANAQIYDPKYKNKFIEKLDQQYLLDDGMTYDMDGVKVSAMKVKRIFYEIDPATRGGGEAPAVDDDLLKLYVLSHGSFYSHEQMDTLRTVIKKTKEATK